MDKPMHDLHFRFMALGFWFRDLFKPRGEVLAEVAIGEGARVLDFGCGPGSYSIKAAELVGPAGMVYALDIHPLAVESVRRAAAKKRLSNVETILSDCATGLDDGNIDVVLLYDTFHGLGDQEGYPDTFVDAMGFVGRAVRSAGGELVGGVPADGYAFDSSEAEQNGTFVGLPLDVDTQAELTRDRIISWVAQLKRSFA